MVYTVSRMGSMVTVVTKAAAEVNEIYQQVIGYLIVSSSNVK